MRISVIYLDMPCAAELQHLTASTLRLAFTCHGYSLSPQVIQEHCGAYSLLDAIRSLLEMSSDDYLEGDEKPIYASFLKLLKVAVQNSQVKPSQQMAELLRQQREQGTSVALLTVFPLHIAELLLRKLNLVEGIHYDYLLSCISHPDWVDLVRPVEAHPQASAGQGLRVAVAGCSFSRAEMEKAHPDLLLSHYADLISYIQCA